MDELCYMNDLSKCVYGSTIFNVCVLKCLKLASCVRVMSLQLTRLSGWVLQSDLTAV